MVAISASSTFPPTVEIKRAGPAGIRSVLRLGSEDFVTLIGLK